MEELIKMLEENRINVDKATEYSSDVCIKMMYEAKNGMLDECIEIVKRFFENKN